MTKEYSIDLQKLFLEMMVQNPESYVRVQNIYNPDNFDRSLRSAAKFIKEHVDKHKAMPSWAMRITVGICVVMVFAVYGYPGYAASGETI